jgi:transcriptional regulator with XRE-family HTH domain
MTLRELREKQGLTQQQLAQKLCVSDSAVRNWETGRTLPGGATTKPAFRLFDRMLQVYKCSWKELCTAMEECEIMMSAKGDRNV